MWRLSTMSNIRLYEQLQREKENQSLLEKEQQMEQANIYLMTVNQKDLPVTEDGKADCKSIGIHLTKYYNALSDKDKNINFCFVCMDDTLKDFINYYIDKKSKNNNDKVQLENKLQDEDYITDIKRIMALKIYQHKYDKKQFCNGNAQYEYYKIEIYKFNRNNSHISIARSLKYTDNNLAKIIDDGIITKDYIKELIFEATEYSTRKLLLETDLEKAEIIKDFSTKLIQSNNNKYLL